MSLLTFTDSFTRSTVNPGWTKSGSNPLATGVGDPAPFYEGGANLYLYVDNLTTGAIDVYTVPVATPDVIGEPTVALALPAGMLFVRDPSPHKVDGVYYIVFSWQPLSGATAATHKIGIASAVSPAGPFTVINETLASRASEGLNEPNPVYHNGFWKLFVTAGTGDAQDIGREDIALFASRLITGPYVDLGSVLVEGTTPLKWQDQHVYQLGGNLVMMLNDDVHNMRQTCSIDGHSWDVPTTDGQLAKGSSGAFDDGGIFALHPLEQKISGQHIGYYQGWDGASTNQVGLATCPTLIRWLMTDATYFECTGTKLRKKSSNLSLWEYCITDVRFRPPYRMEFTLNVESENESGNTVGILFASNLSRRYHLLIDVSANTLTIWDATLATAPTFSHVFDSVTYDWSLATDYDFRITVTPTRLMVEVDDGGGYDVVINRDGFTFAPSPLGFVGYSWTNALNHYTVDDVTFRELDPATPPRIFSKAWA